MQLHSEIYPTEMTMDCIIEQTFIALNDNYNQLYVLTGSNKLDYLEQYNINNNALNILDISKLHFVCNLHYDSNNNGIHYKYNEINGTFIQLSEIKNITNKKYFRNRNNESKHIKSLNKFLLIVKGENQAYARMKSKYKGKSFEFRLYELPKTAKNNIIHTFIGYNHILFAICKRGLWWNNDQYVIWL